MRAVFRLILFHSIYDLFDTVCLFMGINSYLAFFIIVFCLDFLRLVPAENAVFVKSFKILKLQAVSDWYFLQNKTDIIMKQNPIMLLVLPYFPNLKLQHKAVAISLSFLL